MPRLAQSLRLRSSQTAQMKQSMEKVQKELAESRTSTRNEVTDSKRRIEQLEAENEQLRREDIVHVEPTSPMTTTDIQTITLNSEEREKLEREVQRLKQANDSIQQRFDEKEQEYHHVKHQLVEDLEDYKKKFHDIQVNSIRRRRISLACCSLG